LVWTRVCHHGELAVSIMDCTMARDDAVGPPGSLSGNDWRPVVAEAAAGGVVCRRCVAVWVPDARKRGEIECEVLTLPAVVATSGIPFRRR
jgi:hypothetical protein